MMWVLRERLFSVQWLLASLCGLYCVHGLRVSSLCHIARCQKLLVTMYGFRSGGSNGFFPSLFLLELSPSFSPSFPSGHLLSIVCLPDYGSYFSFNSCICADLSFVIILPQAFVFSFFLGLLFSFFFFFFPFYYFLFIIFIILFIKKNSLCLCLFSFFLCLFSACLGF